MREEPNDDQLMNAMLFKLQIQVGVRKPARTPVLLSHNLAWFRREFGPDLATPRAIFEDPSRPGRLLNGRDVFPGLIVARAVSMVERIEDAKPRVPCRNQKLQHIRNAIICLCNISDAIPYFASLGNEVVVGIDDQKCSDLFVELQLCQ